MINIRVAASRIRKFLDILFMRNGKNFTRKHIDSYDNDFLSDIIVAKCKIFSKQIELPDYKFNESQLKLLIPFAFTQKDDLKIIDFGGSAGTHFFIIKRLLGKSRNLDWRIVENRQIVVRSSRNVEKGLSFFDSLSQARLNFNNPDIGIASSVFEYLPDPIESLSDFLSVGCEIIYLTRTCLSIDLETFLGVQTSNLKNNGPGELPEGIKDELISYPIKISPLYDVIPEIEKNYEIIFTIMEKSAVHKFGDNVFDQYGILARKKII